MVNHCVLHPPRVMYYVWVLASACYAVGRPQARSRSDQQGPHAHTAWTGLMVHDDIIHGTKRDSLWVM